MVEVFKTNVEELKASKQIIQVLLEQFPSHKINFDLDDCDKILRVGVLITEGLIKGRIIRRNDFDYTVPTTP
jgi:hypothetical protein